MEVVKESIQRQHLTGNDIHLTNLFISFILPYLSSFLSHFQHSSEKIEKEPSWLSIPTNALVGFDGYVNHKTFIQHFPILHNLVCAYSCNSLGK